MKYLCDSELVLANFLETDKIDTSEVYSCSPNIIQMYADSNQLDKKWDVNSLNLYQKNINRSVLKIDKYLDEKLGKNKYVALITIVRFFRDIYKVSCIDQELLEGGITQVKFKNSRDDRRLDHVDFRWGNFLRGVCDFQERSVEVENFKNLFTEEGNITIFEKLKLKTIKQTLFKVGKKLIRRKEGKVYFYRENELLSDALAEMFFNGYQILPIRPRQNDKAVVPAGMLNTLREVSDYVFEQVFKDLVIDELVSNTKKTLHEDIALAYKESFSFMESWEELTCNMNASRDFIFCGYTSIPAILSLAIIDNRPPLISFQHGVSKELSNQYDEIDCMSDGNVSDLCFYYNNEVRDVESLNSFSGARGVVCGASSSHHKIKRKKIKSAPVKICYLSTNLYRGNLGLFVSAENDYIQSQFEYNLIKKTLSKVRSAIDYKAYPMSTLRYLEKDYVLDEILNYSNINLVEEKKDVRYFLRDYSLIITTHATSTLSWPIFSDIPTIYIDKTNCKFIKTELKELMADALFVFNEGDENFHQSLADFINSDIGEIEKAWKAKEKSRNKLIDQYFSSKASQGDIFLKSLQGLEMNLGSNLS